MAWMFAFLSKRLGCLGSLFVSVIGTIILLAILRGCGSHWKILFARAKRKSLAHARQRMPTFNAPLEGCDKG
jgi:hypothetical protein